MDDKQRIERSRLRLARRRFDRTAITWARKFDRWDRPSHEDDDFARVDYSHLARPRVVGGGSVHAADRDPGRARVVVSAQPERFETARFDDDTSFSSDDFDRNEPAERSDPRR